MKALLKIAMQTAAGALVAIASANIAAAGDPVTPVPAGQPELRTSAQSTATIAAAPVSKVADTLTLSRCIETALKSNPAILAATYGADASKNRVNEARSAYYPQIAASGSYSRVRPAPWSSSAIPGKDQYNVYSSSVTLNQNLIDFGKTFSTVDISKYNSESAQANMLNTQDQVILGVKQAYYGVLEAQRNKDVAADVLKQFQLHLDQAQGFYNVGTKAKIDVIKAQVDLSNAKLGLIKADNALKIAWVTLNNAVGVPNLPQNAVEDNLSFQPYDVVLDSALNRAYENRPDLKSLVAQREASERNISLARTGYYPSLSGNANYNWSDDTTSTVNRPWGWSAGVVLTVPLFSGFLTSNQVAEAKSTWYQVKANEETLRQQIMLDVQQAFLNLQQAQDSIATADIASQQAKENLDLANGRYAAGVGSPIEVSDAFATYVGAQASYTGALYNYKIAQASIEKAMGLR
jgi:outer membrane protein